MKSYGEYVENFDAAVNHIEFLKEQQGEKGKFTQFLNDVTVSRNSKLSLQAYQKSDFGGFKIGLEELLSNPLHQMNEYEVILTVRISFFFIPKTKTLPFVWQDWMYRLSSNHS